MNPEHEIQQANPSCKNESTNTLAKSLVKRFISPCVPLRPNETRIAFKGLRAEEKHGVMIDVGAHLGGSLDPFACSGWRIFAFEPDFDNRHNLMRSYGHFKNVSIDPRAVSDQIQTGLTFYKSTLSTGISGLTAFHPSLTPQGTVDTTTLENFFKEKEITHVDFLKIDAEGFDLFILKGLPWKKVKPLLILCEFDDFKTRPLGYTFHDMSHFLKSHGYKLMISEWFPIKEYGRRHDWRCFATHPYKLRDKKAWGNIFAARDPEIFETIKAICRTFEKSKPLHRITSLLKRSTDSLFPYLK